MQVAEADVTTSDGTRGERAGVSSSQDNSSPINKS